MMKPVRISWLSRHEPTDVQYDHLFRHYFAGKETGNLDMKDLIYIDVVNKSFNNVNEILDMIKGYDDVVVVLPINLIADLTRKGIKPIRAVMKRTVDCAGNVQFEHDYFERVLNVVVEVEKLS